MTMRSYDPSDESDREQAEKIQAEPWQLQLLDLNPGYTAWGPHEDYMAGEGGSWDSPVFHGTWAEFASNFRLDDLNECVNFYFCLDRDSVKCTACNGSGEHPDAQWVSESFYAHSSPFSPLHVGIAGRQLGQAFRDRFNGGGDAVGEVHEPGSFPDRATLARYKPEFRAFCEAMRRGDGFWNDKITQDELDALQASHRFCDYDREAKAWVKQKITVDEVNEAQKNRSFLNSHDGINRCILVRARCERFGIPTTCQECDRAGKVYTQPSARVGLVLWWLHPRKGCSRGIEIANVERDELPDVFVYLREAARRNAERFSQIPPADDACPGCGKRPGDGLTAGCDDAAGCGHWRVERARVMAPAEQISEDAGP